MWVSSACLVRPLEASTVVCSAKNSRVERGLQLINWLKKKPSSTIFVFSDKKNGRWTEPKR
ncbi:Hypothetical protein FKW44_017622 [Caligus rogercresseyi]|uniref:Uncharacterized protein n=1 Tax=Caligus rogercresseyi TaxID=217165 RepID=A0A7T8GT80_CALRO|nr:Hypothetical protein FKW44_017622 [Caligus rogercresseyi]